MRGLPFTRRGSSQLCLFSPSAPVGTPAELSAALSSCCCAAWQPPPSAQGSKTAELHARELQGKAQGFGGLKARPKYLHLADVGVAPVLMVGQHSQLRACHVGWAVGQGRGASAGAVQV